MPTFRDVLPVRRRRLSNRSANRCRSLRLLRREETKDDAGANPYRRRQRHRRAGPRAGQNRAPSVGKINLTPYNAVEGLECSRPSRARQERFQSILRKHGVIATLRREKGHDIAAACGQLRLQTKPAERE